MKISIEKCTDKNGAEHSCFLYDLENKEGEKVTSAEYFVIDVQCDAFKAATDRVGGFTADMTTRMFKEMDEQPTHMALVSLPSKYVAYRLAFAYLNGNKVLDTLYSKSVIDYTYFRNKFKNCLVEKGCSFDLEGMDAFADTKFEEAKSLSVPIGDMLIGVNDTVEIDNVIEIFNEKTKERIKDIGICKARLKLSLSINDFAFNGTVLLDDGEELQKWQYHYGTKNKDKMRSEIRQQYEEKWSKHVTDDDELLFELVEQDANREYNAEIDEGAYELLLSLKVIEAIAKDKSACRIYVLPDST